MTRPRQSKLSIIGAGSVGASLAYASLIRGSAAEVVLYDINTVRAEAEVLDLAHGTPFTKTANISGGSDLGRVADSDVIVITAGAKQAHGQTRLDLAGVNARILDDLLPKLVALSPNAVFVLVTNPCDVLTVLAAERLELPAGRVFSSGTVLDSSRLRRLIADRAAVPATNVHALIVGEHGDSEFALWSQATIGSTPIIEWTNAAGEAVFDEASLEALTTEVVQAAYKVIAGKGATNYAIGLAGARIVEAIVRDEHAILPVSSPLTDYRGVSGVALSVPSIVGSRGVERVLDTPMSDAELALLHRSADAIAGTLASIR